MEKTEAVIDNNSSWLDLIKAKYNVGHEDFTTKYPNGIIVFRGSSIPPNVVFNEGFKRSTDPIWIEDSAYLLQDRWSISRYVEEQIKLNRTKVPDRELGYIVPPGATRGLISTTFSSKKAAWYVAQSFLELAKAKASNKFGHIIMADLEKNFQRIAQVHEPIGYIYALRITQGINISAHFQWADISDPNRIEQEIACLEIPGVDIVYARPVFMSFVPGQGLACTPGDIVQNQNISFVLQPLVSLSDVGFDQELENYKTSKHVGFIGIDRRTREFVFSHSPDQPITLDDGDLSKYYIKPHISKTRSEYLATLKERFASLESASPSTKRIKSDPEQNSGLQYPMRFTDTSTLDEQLGDVDNIKQTFNK